MCFIIKENLTKNRSQNEAFMTLLSHKVHEIDQTLSLNLKKLAKKTIKVHFRNM